MFSLTVVIKVLRHCHSWLTGQYYHNLQNRIRNLEPVSTRDFGTYRSCAKASFKSLC